MRMAAYLCLFTTYSQRATVLTPSHSNYTTLQAFYYPHQFDLIFANDPQLIKVEIVSTELESDVNFGFTYVIVQLI